MKLIPLVLVFLFSLTALAQEVPFQLKVFTHGKEGEKAKTSISEVLSLKPTMKFKAGSPFVLRGYIMGLTADKDGLVKYTVNLRGTHRDWNHQRHIGSPYPSYREEDIRYDEPTYEEANHQMFWKEDIGMWDFYITVQDKVTGDAATVELRGVEVTP